MHHGDDIDKPILNRVEDRIRENVDKNTPYLPIKQAPSLRSIAGMPYGCMNRVNETNLQSHLAPSVEINGSFELEECFWVEVISHFPYF